MARSQKRHPRSEQSRVRRARKERTRRALKAATLPSSHQLCHHQEPTSGSHAEKGSDERRHESEVDKEGMNLYKRAIDAATETYRSRCDKITDGTGSANVIEWGPLGGGRDPMLDLDRDQDTVDGLRKALESAVDDVLKSVVGKDLHAWLNLTRAEQGEQQEIWDVLRPLLAGRAGPLRDELYRLVGVNSRSERGPQKLRAALLKGLLLATSSLSDSDDTEIFDEILEGGVGVGIDEPIIATGRWPRRQVDDEGKTEDLNHGAMGLSLFALDAWKNYVSAATLEPQVRAYLLREVEVGNMEIVPNIPAGGVVSKIAAIEKRPGEENSPIRVIDDLRRSNVNAMVRCEETLQLPGLLTTAFLVHSHRQLVGDGTSGGGLAGQAAGSQVMIEVDCAAAYRNVPVKESERKYCMNFIPPSEGKGGLLIRHSRLPFGLSPSGLLWVRVYSALVLVIKRLIAYGHGEGVQVYIDDLNYLTTRGEAAGRLVAILLLHEAVGIDLSYHKIRVSASPVVLGFEWDLTTGEVSVSHERQRRLASQIERAIERSEERKAVPIRDLQSIIGRAAWMCQIICQLRPWLKGLYARLGIARRKELRGINLTTEAVDSLRFILQTLERPTRIKSTALSLLGAGCTAVTGGVVGVVVSDASLRSMAGLVMMADTSYWFYLPASDTVTRGLINRSIDRPERAKWESGDISSLELIGALAGASLLPINGPGLVLCDNISAVESINRAAGRASRMNKIIMSTSQKLAFGRGLKATHIPTHENWLVDRLSRVNSVEGARDAMAGSSFREVDGVYLMQRLLE